MTSIRRTATIHAPRDEVWAVLGEFDRIATWVPLIQHSCALPPARTGTGAARRVQVAQQTLVERVIDWEPPQRLSYTIEGLPPIAGVPVTTWRLTPMGDDTNVEIVTEVANGWNPARSLVAKQVLKRLGLAADMMLVGLGTATGSDTP
jgi:uncharacterized protein YndB with AHSA1/START domain